jgi:hypothetical protein
MSMPMVIFQQAKDMKIDPGLFFVSVTVLYLFYKLILKYIKHKQDIDFNYKKLYPAFFIV